MSARFRSPCFKLALTALASVFLFEGLVRGVLFHGWFAGVAALEGLREPPSYADPREDAYWQLRALLGRGPHIAAERVDRELGWVPGKVAPGEYEHADRALVGDRRPVLLFGDSYAAGLTPKPALFQSLLKRSPAGERLALVNYGCPGYGLDQTLLLMRRALPLWSDRDPIVLVGILLDDDFERARLEIRTRPKPRFAVRGGELALERERLPDLDDYLEQAVPWWRPWSWRLLVHGGALPGPLAARLRGDAARERACRELAELLLETLASELRARDLVFGCVLFHSRAALLDPAVLGWREALAVETLERLGVPYALSRESLERDVAASGRPLERYYYLRGPQLNHLNRLGNKTVFEGFLPLVEELEAARAWCPEPDPSPEVSSDQ